MENFLRGQQADTTATGGLFDAQADAQADSSAPTCPECGADSSRFFPADGFCAECQNWTAQAIETASSSASSAATPAAQQHRRAA